MQRYPWYDWAVFVFVICAFSGCATPSSSRIEPPVPKSGIYYYSSVTAKLLGSDTSKTLDYRLINPVTYKRIVKDDTVTGRIVNQETILQLKTNSARISVDNCGIQTDLQWVRDSSMKKTIEYQIYLYIDTTGWISSARGLPGNDSSSQPKYRYDTITGALHPIVSSRPMFDYILIGQVHGHPDRKDPSQTTAHHMSSADSTTAQCLQIPIYAVDAMDKRLGRPGKMHRVLPNITSSPANDELHIGSTWGNGFEAKGMFDIGRQALWISGNSHLIDKDSLKKYESIDTVYHFQ
jgi:hypothetical protein